MRHRILLLFAAAFLACNMPAQTPTKPPARTQQHVRGYTRKDGTPVSSYSRLRPHAASTASRKRKKKIIRQRSR